MCLGGLRTLEAVKSSCAAPNPRRVLAGAYQPNTAKYPDRQLCAAGAVTSSDDAGPNCSTTSQLLGCFPHRQTTKACRHPTLSPVDRCYLAEPNQRQSSISALPLLPHSLPTTSGCSICKMGTITLYKRLEILAVLVRNRIDN